MRLKSDLQRWGAWVGALLAFGAIAGAIAMLAFAPRSGASTGNAAAPGLSNTGGSIYVTNVYRNTVTVYPAGSNGNVTPSATIGGSNTGLNYPEGIALDGSGNIYVANSEGNTVTVYPAGSSGNVAPSSTIGGSNTGLNYPLGIALDASGNIYVSNFEAAGAPASSLESNAVTVYPARSNGDTAPSSTIGSSLDAAVGIALNASGNVYVASLGLGTALAGFLTVCTSPLSGESCFLLFANSGLDECGGIAVDASGNIYATEDGSQSEDPGPDTVTVYPAGSNFNAPPSSTIDGSNTGLSVPSGIALDVGGNIYVANFHSDTVTAYPTGSNGNVAPSATIAGPATGLGLPAGIAIGPEQPTSQTPTPTPTPTPSPTPSPTPTPAPVAAKLAASATSLTFAERAEGTTSKAQVVTLTNAKTKKQNHTITVIGVLASGDFAVPGGACVGPLSAGQKCKISITFTPKGTGTLKGSLKVTSNASNPSLTVLLKGTGKK